MANSKGSAPVEANANAPVSQAAMLARGGMWDSQRLLGGLRLKDTFAKGESFVLWELEVVGSIELEDKPTPKVELTVSRLDSADDRFAVGTLSKAIVTLAEAERVDGDLPIVCHWDEVETKRKQNPAVVIIAERPFQG